MLRDRGAHPYEQTRQQSPILVLEQGARVQSSGRRVDLRRGIVHVALVRIAFLALQPDFDRHIRQARRAQRDAVLGEVSLERQDLRLAQREIDVERIGLHDR